MTSERPPSAANSVSTTHSHAHSHSQSNNAQSHSHSHKRTLSTKPAESKTPTATIISLFVKNVRLLNLDLLPDWPVITPGSFTQDARMRIRCTEWCLYQLFRVYDPSTTSEKLQPFFPPLEPLQSLNLRAAIYRCLNELKKNGVLGRETVLRKSMLDDCQGDKFWELCLSFSSIVLRKVTVDKRNGFTRPVSERIGLSPGLTRDQCDSMLPLAIAHRAQLHRVLSTKQRKRQSFARLFDALVDKGEDLAGRKLHAHQRGRSQIHEASIAEEVLDKHWIGSDDLRSALINGDDAAGGDSLLTRSFDSVWRANEADKLFSRDTMDTGLLDDLANRTEQQKKRWRRWQSFHEDLLNSRPPSSRDSMDSAKAFTFSFDKHQNMTLRDIADEPLPPSTTWREKHDSVARYDAILTAMREELRKKSAAAQAMPSPPKPEPEPEATPKARPQSYRQPSISQESVNRLNDAHSRSNSQTAVAMRPAFGQRMSSRSRSYQQPKIISQREIIPLKSELFSPLKQRQSSISPSSSGRVSQLASPIEEPSPTSGQIDDVVAGAAHQMQLGGTGDRAADVANISRTNTPTFNDSGASTPRSAVENPDSAVEISSKLAGVSAAGRNVDGVGRTLRPSLADRTRMSMAIKSSDEVALVPSIGSDVIQESNDISNADDFINSRRLTLHERTRQSISVVPQSSTAVPLKINKRPSHSRSRTSAFPVNPFETPDKAARRRSTLALDVGMPRERRDITPREKLFEEDAEYNSIFRARPKIAVSPVGTPSFVEEPDEMDMASPSGGRG